MPPRTRKRALELVASLPTLELPDRSPDEAERADIRAGLREAEDKMHEGADFTEIAASIAKVVGALAGAAIKG